MKTKTSKLFCTMVAVLTLFVCSNVRAQSGPGKLRFGIGMDGLFPVDNASNTPHFGLGITPRLQYGVSDRFALTFTSGIYHFFPKTVTYPASGSFPGFTVKHQSDIIPVKVGAKYFVSQNFYLAGEMGAAFQVANGGGPVNFLWSPGIGYATKKWDLGARYESFSGSGYSNGMAAVRVAYGFGL